MPVNRNEIGHWWHPAFPWGAIPDDTDCTPWFEKWGYVPEFVSMQSDASDEAMDLYWSNGDGDCTHWVPNQPAGEGWFLAAIYDSEDGPFALFVREAQPSGRNESHQ